MSRDPDRPRPAAGSGGEPTGVDLTATAAVPESGLPGGVPHPKARPWPAGHVPTAFQRAVIDVVAALPPRDLVTFGEVGELAGREMGGQAVANVLRGMPGLPWWRVLPAGGRLYGDLAAVQAPLLRLEGHGVDENRRVHPHPVDTDACPATSPGQDPQRNNGSDRAAGATGPSAPPGP